MIKSKIFRVAVFILVFGFTFILRAHNFDRSPTMGNLEEMLYAWSGIYLVETGTPVSWSTLDYPKRAEVFSGTIDYQGGKPTAGVKLYKPWLDEPPLFSYLVGFFGHLYGANRNEWIPTAFIRTPVVAVAAFASIFVFLVARLLSGYWTGILAMLVYGTIPLMVFASRLAVPENVVAAMLIFMVYLILKFNDKGKFIYLAPIPLLVGIAGLSKPVGFFLLPLAVYFTLAKRSYRSCLYLVLASLPFILFFFWYGIHLDAEIFWRITSIQSLRPVGFSSLAWFFTSPAYDWRIFTDSWYVFTLLAAAFFLFHPPEGAKWVVPFAFVYWVGVIMISGGEGDLLGWYRFPIFPLLAILGAWGLQLLVRRANFFTVFLAAGMLLGGRHLLVNVFHPNVTPTAYRLVLASLLVPAVMLTIFKLGWLKQACRLIIIGVIVVGIYFNIKAIYNEYEIRCQGAECILGPQTGLSKLHFPVIWRLFVLD